MLVRVHPMRACFLLLLCSLFSVAHASTNVSASSVKCYVYEQTGGRRGGNGHISPWGPDNATLAKIATVKSCASGQCFKTEKYVGERYSDFTAGCDTTGRCKGVADGAQTVEKGASVFESSTEVFCCSGDTCNGANARAVWHPLILLFALLLGSAATLP